MKTDNEKKVNESVRKKFIELRKLNGYTQVELAEILSMSRTSITNIEAGIQHVNAAMIYILSCLYNVEISDFYPKKRRIALRKKRVYSTVIEAVRV